MPDRSVPKRTISSSVGSRTSGTTSPVILGSPWQLTARIVNKKVREPICNRNVEVRRACGMMRGCSQRSLWNDERVDYHFACWCFDSDLVVAGFYSESAIENWDSANNLRFAVNKKAQKWVDGCHFSARPTFSEFGRCSARQRKLAESRCSTGAGTSFIYAA